MPKKSLQQVLSQIEALQREAEELRSAEVKDVIARIQEAISHYQLTPKDLFPSKKAGEKGAVAAPSKSSKAVRTKRAAAGKRGPGAPKYVDPAGSGKTWTGQGKRPGWFVSALEAGKQAEDLLIK